MAALLVPSVVALLAACSEAPKLVAQGGECAATADCELGLVCVPQQKGGRICTADLRSVSQVPQQPAPADAGRDARDGGDAGDASATSDAPVDAATDAVTPPADAAAE